MAGTPLDPAKRDRIAARLLAGETPNAVGQAEHAHPNTVARVRRDLLAAGHDLVAAAKPADPIKARQERDAAEQRRREHVDAVKELAFRDTVRQTLEAVVPALDPPPAYRPRPAPKGVVTESMLLHLSDWHFAEWVRPDNVFGLNEFNREVADRRVRRVVDTTLEVKARLETGGYRFPVLTVAANGDMVSGSIHELERHTDGPNVMRVALDCAGVLAAALRDLSGAFERVYVFGTAGNHGRLGDAKKVQTKDPTRSWDYLIYEHARALTRECPNVTFEVPDAWAVMYELEGHLFYQGHGHFVKSWNSIPFYGINRMTARLGSVLARHLRPVDYWLFGHFHVQGSIENAGGEYLINPPLIGPQEFGIHSFGDAVPPGQTLFGVHPKHGITHRWRVAAEDVWPPPGRRLNTTKIRSGGSR